MVVLQVQSTQNVELSRIMADIRSGNEKSLESSQRGGESDRSKVSDLLSLMDRTSLH